MKKDIIILANFTGDFSSTDNNRFLYLSKMSSIDNDVEVVTSDFYHVEKEFRCDIAMDNLCVTLLMEPCYKKNISIKRFHSHYIWGKNVKKYLEDRKKPDVIYAAVPSLTASFFAAKYCEKNNIKFIIDVNDLWPEAFRMAVDIPVLSDIAFWPFKKIADAIYKRADYIFGVSQSYVDRALRVNNKCVGSKAVFIGTDLNTFDENVKNNPVEKLDGELWLGYCGSLSASYDLITVMDALVLLRNQGLKPPKFVVMGDGAKRAEFESYASEKKLDVFFTGMLPYGKMCGMLSACDIVVNPIKGKSAASIINKHADYAACGRPVINTQESPEYRALIEKYNMGYNCKNGSAVEVAQALAQLCTKPYQRYEMGCNARKCAEERFDRRKTYIKIIRLICNYE